MQTFVPADAWMLTKPLRDIERLQPQPKEGPHLKRSYGRSRRLPRGQQKVSSEPRDLHAPAEAREGSGLALQMNPPPAPEALDTGVWEVQGLWSLRRSWG